MRDASPPEVQEGADFWISPDRQGRAPVDVTIIIPTYQAEATLSRAVRSVIEQSLRNIEIIVADDGSTDSSWRQIADWLPGEPRLRALRNHRNRGKSTAMNCATRFARGRWLAVLDADDWYHPNRLAALVAIGETAQADMVADNQLFYDAAAETIIGPAWPIIGPAWPIKGTDARQLSSRLQCLRSLRFRDAQASRAHGFRALDPTLL
jgi:glycosyltransferase involved in cell wall biosynthesis